MYSRYNERKSVLNERFTLTLKSKLFKHMTAVSKNVYFDVLINQLTLQLILMLNVMKILMKKILNLKLVIMLEFQNAKTFLLKDKLKIGRKKCLLLPKLKIQFRADIRDQ